MLFSLKGYYDVRKLHLDSVSRGRKFSPFRFRKSDISPVQQLAWNYHLTRAEILSGIFGGVTAFVSRRWPFRSFSSRGPWGKSSEQVDVWKRCVISMGVLGNAFTAGEIGNAILEIFFSRYIFHIFRSKATAFWEIGTPVFILVKSRSQWSVYRRFG